LTGFRAQIGHFGSPQWFAACMGHSCAIPHPQSRSCDSWHPVAGEIICNRSRPCYLTPEGHPKYLKLSPLSGFTRQAISDWAKCSLAPTSLVLSDGLACFNGVTDADCHHQVIVAGGKKPRDLPDFKWVNTIIGNVKTSLNGAYHAFRFGKYSERCLGAIVYRFNRRFNLRELPNRLLVAAIVMGPSSSATIRSPETAY